MPVVLMTEVTIRHLKPPPAGAKIYVDRNLKGFGVRITAAGAQSYVLTYGTERKRITLGEVGIVKLADARDKARKTLAEMQLGKPERPVAKTFDQLLHQFLQTHCVHNKPSTALETERLLTRHFLPDLRDRTIDTVHTSDIMGIVDVLAKTPSEANHAFTAAKTFFSWALGRGHVERNPLQALKKPAKVVSRDRVLSDQELKHILEAAQSMGQYGHIVQLLILTGQRLGQIVGLQSEFIDSTAKTITWPAQMMKSNREHRLPIGEDALILLGTLASQGALFSTAKGQAFNNWSSTKQRLGKQVAAKLATANAVRPRTPAHWTLHDLRRTFATIHARLGTPPHVVERMLAHTSGAISGVSAIYNRHSYMDEMRAAQRTYEAHIAKLVQT